ncbi:hypothetical protein KC367_g120 [Hortaea werneckii]|nr:hypothetical protein KC367_g120 [Hortaea werneckii]
MDIFMRREMQALYLVQAQASRSTRVASILTQQRHVGPCITSIKLQSKTSVDQLAVSSFLSIPRVFPRISQNKPEHSSRHFREHCPYGQRQGTQTDGLRLSILAIAAVPNPAPHPPTSQPPAHSPTPCTRTTSPSSTAAAPSSWSHPRGADTLRTELQRGRQHECGRRSAEDDGARGYGTLEELMEVVTWNQLGIHGMPVVVYNVEGYWDGLMQWVRKAVSAGFVGEGNKGIMVEAREAEDVVAALKSYQNAEGRFKLDWGAK